MPSPLVSVVLPVYNARSYLRPAIESVLAQTFENFELLVMDDGSTDGSAALADQFRDPRIRVLALEHSGLIATLNRGLKEVAGDLIARMDADDICLPERLADQVAFLQARPDVVAVGAAAHVIDAQGARTGRTVVPPSEHEDILAGILFRRPTMALVHPSVTLRAAAVREAGGYREPFPVSEDSDLWLRLSRAGRLHSLRQPLLLLRKHEQNVSALQTDRQLRSHMGAVVCQLVWERTGVDLADECPALWRVCEDRIAGLIQERGVSLFLATRRQIGVDARKRTVAGLIRALACAARRPEILFLRPNVLCGRICRGVAAELAERVASRESCRA